ncbi:MAG: M67 family metallopeptidase [Halofilum sp. (in: g-proteobacteria)]|nr:M67 family metallopeptidase [Halofilum sp. (in: g-proteobacteria)]
MAPRLYLRAAQRRRIRELSLAAWPLEACGLLEGPDVDGPRTVVAIHPMPNVDPAPDRRYTIDPEDWLRLEHAARRRGQTIIGVWHSHPHGDPAPSPTDRELAWPGWSYLIAGVTNTGMRDLRCWQIDERGCHEQPIVTETS